MLNAEEERLPGIAECHILIREPGWSGPSLNYDFMFTLTARIEGEGEGGGGVNFWSKSNCFAFVPTISDQIKTFCFRLDNKWTKSKCFASIYKFLYYIETFYVAQDKIQTK
jgi:hypothetical protein